MLEYQYQIQVRSLLGPKGQKHAFRCLRVLHFWFFIIKPFRSSDILWSMNYDHVPMPCLFWIGLPKQEDSRLTISNRNVLFGDDIPLGNQFIEVSVNCLFHLFTSKRLKSFTAKKTISIPLRMENPVKRPIVPPITPKWSFQLTWNTVWQKI